jgi:hypothetical protein
MSVRERWTANGFEITHGWTSDVETRVGLMRVAAPRITSSPQPGATHGELVGGRRKHLPAGFNLAVWCGDVTREAAEQRYEEVLRSVGQQWTPTDWRRTLADGTVRQAFGRLVNSIAPEPIGSMGMRFGLEVMVHSGFWRDLAGTTDTTTGALPRTLALTSKARSTGPMADLVCTITGPVTNPQVLSLDTGLGFIYSGVVAAGQTLTVDSGTWLVTGTGGLLPTVELLTWTHERYLEVPAAVVGSTPSVVFSGSGSSGATSLSVQGTSCFLA